MLENGSFIEVAQLAVATIGISLGFWKLWVAISNGLLIAVTVQDDGPHRVVAETQILGELFRISKQGILVVLGVVSVLLPPPHATPIEGGELLQHILLRLGLMALTVLMVADSLIQEFRRRHFLDIVRRKVRVQERQDDDREIDAAAIKSVMVDPSAKP